MQFMWVWIDEFIGKGLDVFTISQFIGLLSTTLVPIALPLGILFAAIMTFGNLGESSELTAVKAAGISVIRFATPLLLFITGIACLSFLFNNYLIPEAKLKATRLLYDIQNKKPVLAIKPGRFNKDIPNHIIYISSKDDDDNTIRDIKIYDHTDGRGNNKITTAKKGKMYVTEDKKFLVFELEDGWRYEEKLAPGQEAPEQIRLGFRFWKKIFDLSDFKLPTTDENYFKNMREVMSVSQIMVQLDTNKLNMHKIILDAKNQMAPLLSYVRDDTAKHRTPLPSNSTQTQSFWQQIPDSLQSGVLSQAEISARSMKSILEVNVQNLSLQQMNFTDSKIELNKRFALPFACILLFLIGAALGSIIRKGGLGMPFISAVLFFILYYFMNTIGEKIAKENVVTVEVGIWAPSFILTLIAAFLLYKANNDSPLFNKETYVRFGERIKSIFTKSTSSPSVS
ncbi:MAG: hypothetical protein RIQ62_289 [Bacteroidota bacterium]|jgi:lipopolysaccharide export system permease protein